jgi:SAM-dependent methyltransferase
VAIEVGDTTGAGASPEPIFQVASGFMAAKHLFIACELGLFEGLGGGAASLDELVSRTGIARNRLRVVIDAMVALGFVQRRNDHYLNGPAAQQFLSGRAPVDLRPFLRFWNRLSYPIWTNFETAVRTGRGQSSLHLSEEDQRIFSEGVEAIQVGPSHALPSAYDFGRHRRVLDLGGGTGSWLLAILERYRELHGTLFELPMAAAIARKRLADAQVASRAQIVNGDFFKDPIPLGHDAVLVANVIHLFSLEHNLELLRRVRLRVPIGARLLLVDFWTDASHTDPTFAAIMAGEFLVITGEGDVYSEDEVRGWLEQTGWRALERIALTGPISVVVAETA